MLGRASRAFADVSQASSCAVEPMTAAPKRLSVGDRVNRQKG
jgi:hypothetical protein